MKVALVHDWLTGMRGGERCLEVFCELFPQADIYTLLHVAGSASSLIEKHPIRTSAIQYLPFSSTRYRYYLPLFPRAVEAFDLSQYDLVLSSSHCVAKGVRVPPGACHISYVYTPMRYVWDQYGVYFSKAHATWSVRAAMALSRRRLQQWDVSSNDGVRAFVAISEHVARRVKRYYGRDALVVYPPVDWHSFAASHKDEGFYLMVTAFAPYKRVDLAIEAFNRLNVPLKIVGSGQDDMRLKRIAGPSIEFLGWRSDEEVRDCYSRCRAVVFPGEEDFGIVPLEAMASGKPVIAFAKGGVLESVVPLNPAGPSLTRYHDTPSVPTGILFYEQTVGALAEAIQLFERNEDRFNAQSIREHVAPFDRIRFKEKMRDLIKQTYDEFRVTRPC